MFTFECDLTMLNEFLSVIKYQNRLLFSQLTN